MKNLVGRVLPTSSKERTLTGSLKAQGHQTISQTMDMITLQTSL